MLFRSVRTTSPAPSKLYVKRGAANTLAIANTGGQHLYIQGWRLRDSSGAVVAEASGPGYLLAGAQRALAIAGGHVSGPVLFEADSDAGVLKIDVGG